LDFAIQAEVPLAHGLDRDVGRTLTCPPQKKRIVTQGLDNFSACKSPLFLKEFDEFFFQNTCLLEVGTVLQSFTCLWQADKWPTLRSDKKIATPFGLAMTEVRALPTNGRQSCLPYSKEGNLAVV